MQLHLQLAAKVTRHTQSTQGMTTHKIIPSSLREVTLPSNLPKQTQMQAKWGKRNMLQMKERKELRKKK